MIYKYFRFFIIVFFCIITTFKITAADQVPDIRIPPGKENEHLCIAIKQNDLGYVEAALAAGADPDEYCQLYKNFRHFAAIQGAAMRGCSVPVIQALCKHSKEAQNDPEQNLFQYLLCSSIVERADFCEEMRKLIASGLPVKKYNNFSSLEETAGRYNNVINYHNALTSEAVKYRDCNSSPARQCLRNIAHCLIETEHLATLLQMLIFANGDEKEIAEALKKLDPEPRAIFIQKYGEFTRNYTPVQTFLKIDLPEHEDIKEVVASFLSSPWKQSLQPIRDRNIRDKREQQKLEREQQQQSLVVHGQLLEKADRERKMEFFQSLGLTFLCGGIICGGIYYFLKHCFFSQNKRA